MIIGRRLEELYPRALSNKGRRALEVRDVSGPRLAPTRFDVHEGEILGLTGLAGMGFEDVPYLLSGAADAYSGTVEMPTQELRLEDMSPARALNLGLVLVPAQRERDGAVLTLSLAENLTLPRVSQYFRFLHMDYALEEAEVRRLAEAHDVRPPEPNRLLGTLSGGNQQKAIVAKWLAMKPSVLLLHEPTQGVDIGARKQLFAHIRGAANSGAAVLLASIEYEDLANLCDRVLVFQDGRIVAELDGDNLSKDRILECAYRVVAGGAT
jgi:ribose transport system ATP-binding protein